MDGAYLHPSLERQSKGANRSHVRQQSEEKPARRGGMLL